MRSQYDVFAKGRSCVSWADHLQALPLRQQSTLCMNVFFVSCESRVVRFKQVPSCLAGRLKWKLRAGPNQFTTLSCKHSFFFLATPTFCIVRRRIGERVIPGSDRHSDGRVMG